MGQSAASAQTGQSADANAASGTGSASTAIQRAEVTDIREIINNSSEQVKIKEGKDDVATIDPQHRWVGSTWIPWVGNEGEIGKSITISWNGTTRYWIFQDYWNTLDMIRYSMAGSYAQSTPVPGSNTGAGRKILTIGSDGTLSLQPSG
jgi:hypothetical protein